MANLCVKYKSIRGLSWLGYRPWAKTWKQTTQCITHGSTHSGAQFQKLVVKIDLKDMNTFQCIHVCNTVLCVVHIVYRWIIACSTNTFHRHKKTAGGRPASVEYNWKLHFASIYFLSAHALFRYICIHIFTQPFSFSLLLLLLYL